MAKPPLYHQTAAGGHGGIPGWWFGAPVVAFVYVLVIPRFLPDLVSIPDALPAGLSTVTRWFIGLMVGVALATTWQIVRWARARRPSPPR
jgi:hypothetical protein